MSDEIATPIRTGADIIAARKAGREIAASLAFSATDQVLIATAISELARNILTYARQGEIRVIPLENGGRRGLVVEARDDGPGIEDVARALEVGFSTSGGLGLGLPGVRRLMDDFRISSGRESGTTIVVTKWRT